MLAGLTFAAVLTTSQMGFDEAKALADRNEASLDRQTSGQLVAAQGKALREAVAACARPDADVSPFVVVLSLNPDGSTAASWLRGSTSLARCVRNRLADIGLAGHWTTPFYTSFEVSFDGT